MTVTQMTPKAESPATQSFPHHSRLTDEELRTIEERCGSLAESPDWPAGVRSRFAQISDGMRELIHRRREDVTTRGLERSMAFDFASAVLDGEALPADRNGEADYDWLDMTSARGEDGEFPEHIEEVIRYLDSRGLIERDPEHPEWIAILDESEANDIQALAARHAAEPVSTLSIAASAERTSQPARSA